MTIRYPVGSGPRSGLMYLDVRDYGAKLDGVTDDRAAFQAAVDAAVASITAGGRGAVVQFSGVAYFGSGANAGVAAGSTAGLSLPRALAANLTIRGTGRDTATIKLSSSCINVAWLNKVADFDTFQNITLEDFTVDCNNAGTSGVTGKAHVLIGTIPGNNTQQTKLSFDRITIRRIRGRNIPVDEATASAARRFIAFIGNNTSTTTGTSSRRIVVEDVETDGGAGLAEVTSYGAGSDGNNHYYEDIRFARLRHIIPNPPAANGGVTSFYICGTGYGDYCEMVDCYSQNSSDDAVELGMMRRVLLDRVRAVNPFLVGYTIRNTHSSSLYGTTWNPDEQEITLRNCSMIVTAAATTAVTSGSQHRFLAPILDTNGGNWGTLKLVDSYCRIEGDSFAKSGQSNQFVSITTATPFRRVELIRPRVHLKNYTADGAQATLNAIQLQLGGTWTTGVIRDADVKVEGMTPSSSVNLFPSAVSLGGTDMNIVLDGLAVDWNAMAFTNGGAFRIIDAGSGTIRGSIKRVFPKAGSMTGVGTVPVNLNGTTVDLSLTVTDCDFSKMSGTTSDFAFGAANNALRTRVRDVRHKTAPTSVTTPTVGASPYTYSANAGYDEEVYVTGGTVSLIERSDLSGAGFVDSGRTSGTWLLRPGQSIKITYTVAPTVKRTPVS